MEGREFVSPAKSKETKITKKKEKQAPSARWEMASASAHGSGHPKLD